MATQRTKLSIRLTKKYYWISKAVELEAERRERTENFLLVEALREHFKKPKNDRTAN